MVHACATSSSLHAVVAGDSDGVIHVLDPRAGGGGAAATCAGMSGGGLPGWLANAAGSSSSGGGGSRRGAEVLRAQVGHLQKLFAS